MSVKSLLAKPFASLVCNQIKKGAQTAIADQETIFKTLIKKQAVQNLVKIIPLLKSAHTTISKG